MKMCIRDRNTPVLDDEGKNLILRKIAGDIEPELLVLKGNMKRLGYISEVKSVLSEFDQYDIGEEELDCVMKRAGEESYPVSYTHLRAAED